VSETSAAQRLSITWSIDAQADLRAIDRETALDILHCIDRYLTVRVGDVKKLKPPMTGFRLRCGDYRIFFKQAGEFGIAITGVYHRRDAYR
jgi:mRNA-degrading endonuclease RelE of RelBE toxin-antitoxin system